MSRLADKKKQERAAAKKNKLERRRAAKRQKDLLNKPLDDGKSKGSVNRSIMLKEDGPIPPRNGPCPIHPEHKLKKCPHKCLQMFIDHRSSVAGDVVFVPVAQNDKRAGRLGFNANPENVAANLAEELKGKYLDD